MLPASHIGTIPSRHRKFLLDHGSAVDDPTITYRMLVPRWAHAPSLAGFGAVLQQLPKGSAKVNTCERIIPAKNLPESTSKLRGILTNLLVGDGATPNATAVICAT